MDRSFFESKGKIYTRVVAKDEVPALIQTTTHLIHGHIYVRPDGRLLDELNQASDFLPVTRAAVLGADGQEIQRAQFLSISRAHIVWVLPEQDTHAHEKEDEV